MQNVTLAAPRTRALEFGIYRDGDNNLDASQEDVLTQARAVSANDRAIEFTVEDTRHGLDDPKTIDETIADGRVGHQVLRETPHDMASPQNLANFVARTLDAAEISGAKQTWIELVDHGAGDGGGLEADSTHHIMPMPDIAQAIADGVAMHAKEHPEDASRGIDGVVANQCLMSSLGFADALSHAGVKYLAASPETMISPGVPSAVAEAIARNMDDPQAMAKSAVNTVMNYKYGDREFGYTPAAAFDVLDLDRAKMQNVESSVKALNDAIASTDSQTASRIRNDAQSVDGMARFPDATPNMPWHSDRPAIALYEKVSKDTRVDANVRKLAANAAHAVNGIVLAHKESSGFAPFDGSSYADAAGPTVHFATKAAQVDPWAPKISETNNRFFKETDAAAMERVIA